MDFQLQNIKNNNYIKSKYKTQEKEKEIFQNIEFNNNLINLNPKIKTENKNIKKEIIGEKEKDKINYYKVQKINIINYMTPIKVNNIKIDNKNKKNDIKIEDNNINDRDNNEEISNLFSNSSTDNKKVMVSELDIELSNSNSNSNYFTDYKNNGNNFEYINSNNKSNNINIIKREIDFKKEIEQNLKKFLKNNEKNQTKMKNNIENNKQNYTANNNEKGTKIKIKDITKANVKLLKKKNYNFNYCLTDVNNKNSMKNKSNKLSSFIMVKNKLNFAPTYHNNTKINNSFKSKEEKKIRSNNNKNFNEIIKINIPKRINKIKNRLISNMRKRTYINYNKNQKPMNYTNIDEIKRKIFNMQNKNKKNIKNNCNQNYYSHRNNNNKNFLTDLELNNININDEIGFEKRKNTENPNKKDFHSFIKNDNFQKIKEKINLNINGNNINEKNIIIQNLNLLIIIILI